MSFDKDSNYTNEYVAGLHEDMETLEAERDALRKEVARLKLRENEWDGYQKMHDRLWDNMQLKDVEIERLRAEIALLKNPRE